MARGSVIKRCKICRREGRSGFAKCNHKEAEFLPASPSRCACDCCKHYYSGKFTQQLDAGNVITLIFSVIPVDNKRKAE